MLLKPVPFAEPDRIVSLQVVTPGWRYAAASPAKFAHWNRQTHVVETLAAFQQNRLVNYTGGDVPEQLRSAQVSSDYFQLFGAPIVRGRVFAPEEDRPNGPRVVLISERLWERLFARDPRVVGRFLSLSGEPHVVVGVVGRGFDVHDLGPDPDVWTPMQLDPNTESLGHYFQVAARLRPGVSLGEAQTARFIASFLFEVEAWDPTAFIAVPLVLAAVAMVAVMVPAHHASRVDPNLALRSD